MRQKIPSRIHTYLAILIIITFLTPFFQVNADTEGTFDTIPRQKSFGRQPRDNHREGEILVQYKPSAINLKQAK